MNLFPPPLCVFLSNACLLSRIRPLSLNYHKRNIYARIVTPNITKQKPNEIIKRWRIGFWCTKHIHAHTCIGIIIIIIYALSQFGLLACHI